MAILKGEKEMKNNNLAIENARIGFRNFAGKEGQYNPAGRRNFSVFLERELAEILERDGWNIKWLQPKEEGDDLLPHLSVAVNYNNMPPQIYLVTGKGKTLLSEEDVHILDWAEIKNVDLTITPYNWEVNKKSGIKAYLKTMYITIYEDEFASKYYDVPDSAASSYINK